MHFAWDVSHRVKSFYESDLEGSSFVVLFPYQLFGNIPFVLGFGLSPISLVAVVPLLRRGDQVRIRNPRTVLSRTPSTGISRTKLFKEGRL